MLLLTTIAREKHVFYIKIEIIDLKFKISNTSVRYIYTKITSFTIFRIIFSKYLWCFLCLKWQLPILNV